MVSLTALEPPLRIAVRVSGNNATDRVMAVAALTVIERVAPFARVAASGELLPADAVVEAAPLAFGVLADGSDPLIERAARTADAGPAMPIIEDDSGRWFVFDDEGQRHELEALSGWALVGVALDCPRMSATTASGRALVDVLKANAAGHGADLVNAAMEWGGAEVDRILAGLAASDPARVRGWLAEQTAELAQLRAAHDALRARYDRDLAAVRDAGDRDG